MIVLMLAMCLSQSAPVDVAVPPEIAGQAHGGEEGGSRGQPVHQAPHLGLAAHQRHQSAIDQRCTANEAVAPVTEEQLAGRSVGPLGVGGRRLQIGPGSAEWQARCPDLLDIRRRRAFGFAETRAGDPLAARQTAASRMSRNRAR
mgnify:CR=1 FL=1